MSPPLQTSPRGEASIWLAALDVFRCPGTVSFTLKLVGRNALRHKLRTALTLLGMVVAVLAFGLLQTVVGAWYANADQASPTRLVTRNAISLVFPLPLAYYAKIKAVDGVRAVAWANWFGAIYKEPKYFFPQFAVSDNYLDLYPEFVLSDDARRAFQRDRMGCVIGRKIAETHGIKVGDTMTLKGTIFPGEWNFVVRGIYEGATRRTDLAQMFFHWEYLNETMRRTVPRRADYVGVYVVDVAGAERMGEVAQAIDAQFRDSAAETLSETEKAFQLGFVSMTEAIVVAIRLVSYLVIFIIMAVMANTMAMTARERTAEYATLKAIGFGPGFIAALIFAESLLLAMAGAALGVAITFPLATEFSRQMGTLFPVFEISAQTVALQFACAAAVGVLAAVLPARRAATVNIVAGLRHVA
jgi:putative ABC transport system permease protein